jgi:hypothetical protein
VLEVKDDKLTWDKRRPTADQACEQNHPHHLIASFRVPEGISIPSA